MHKTIELPIGQLHRLYQLLAASVKDDNNYKQNTKNHKKCISKLKHYYKKEDQVYQNILKSTKCIRLIKSPFDDL